MTGRMAILLKLRWLPLFMLLLACVDRVEFSTPPAGEQLVVEGVISDEPGPYTVLLSIASSNNAPVSDPIPVTGAGIELYEDGVKIDSYVEEDAGIYRTASTTRGVAGRTYHIVITTVDGSTYSSEPEEMIASGTIDDLTYEFESFDVVQHVPGSDGDTLRFVDRFNIFIDATTANGDGFLRWRTTGTYHVKTYPELAFEQQIDGTIVPTPWRCSGVIWDGFNLVRVGPCECCDCWVIAKEKSPLVSDQSFLIGDDYTHIKVSEVVVTPRTFFDKYRVEVEQMSMSKKAHEFFRLIKAQSDGIGSLFQPPFGTIRGNIIAQDPNQKVLGLFWTTSVYRKYIYLNKDNVPKKVLPIDTVKDRCLYIGAPNSSTLKPSFWQ
ncbi:MAG TPA: DUF4249 domain-containing protein [Cyclobacteriaceae bacterium]|nr:DUF4249 domain-containing protein [Cyclobacteriaceae bacterium]